MVIAYIMLKVGLGEYQSLVLTIKESLIKMPEILEATPVFGRHDLVLKVEVNSLGDLTRLVGDKIRALEGVADSETLVAHEEQ